MSYFSVHEFLKKEACTETAHVAINDYDIASSGVDPGFSEGVQNNYIGGFSNQTSVYIYSGRGCGELCYLIKY